MQDDLCVINDHFTILHASDIHTLCSVNREKRYIYKSMQTEGILLYTTVIDKKHKRHPDRSSNVWNIYKQSGGCGRHNTDRNIDRR